MAHESKEELTAAVYGELFASAKTTMDQISAEVHAQRDVGFDSFESCAAWAHSHLLDIVIYTRAHGDFMYLTHQGVPCKLGAWKRMYSDVLFVRIPQDKGPDKCIPWAPNGIEYHDNAKLLSEESDGTHQPIAHRDYVTPTGYFDPVAGRFNVAIPFPVFAKETGRDTSHLFTYIDKLAGPCAPYLLAWLRQKILHPKMKTEIMPIIVSRKQGNGKSTFVNVICKGLFGKQNVVVTTQYDPNARFNTDVADALIVCVEEKREDDKRIDNASMKSNVTNDTVRKEHKGLDPTYQASYTEYIFTTNKEVPMKFDSTEDQRRFMIMESDPEFTRYKVTPEGVRVKNSNLLADQIFSKLYGVDEFRNPVGTPFIEDTQLIAQFKHELITRPDIAGTDMRQFPKTDAYYRNQSIPRTTEQVEIDSILRTLAPFILESLRQHRVVPQITTEEGQVLSLTSFLTTSAAIQMVGAMGTEPTHVALCRPLVFFDQASGKPYNHATVERGIVDCGPWLLREYGILVLANQLPLKGGFQNVLSRYRQAPAARFALAQEEDIVVPEVPVVAVKAEIVKEERIGARLRVNKQWKPDPLGEYETVNELKPGVTTLEGKSSNVQYLDTFLFEADDTDKQTYLLEQTRLKNNSVKSALNVFMERLRLQRSEADRLLDSGVAFRVVYSGGKSYHILVRIKDAPITLEEYKWLHAYLCQGIISKKLEFDPACNDPARLTRAPITKERTFEYNGATVVGTQMSYRELPGQVLDLNWRFAYNEWLNRPLDPWETLGKRLRPAKQEYKDAMWALLNGTFWTDSIWNGQRQQCFFPAYRLCRLVGYSHDQLWAPNGILDGLDKYYRKGEIQYWKNRETSDIIKQIDSDVAEQLAAEEGYE